MSQVFVGNLDSQVSEKDLKDEFRFYGSIRRWAWWTLWYSSKDSLANEFEAE